MEYSITLGEQADDDQLAAMYYYESINTNLAEHFAAELIAAYDKLRSNPEHYSFISSNPKDTFRDIKLKIFPYVIIYQIRGQIVFVLRVLSTHQKPIINR